MPIEIWKTVDGYEGIYEVSAAGNVRNSHSGRMLNGDIAKGYRRVGLYFHGQLNRVMVHRLVLTAFVGKQPDGLRRFCNHKNGVRLDNRPENLEWVTSSENSLHAVNILHTHKQKGSKHGRHKLIESHVIEIIARMARGDSLLSVCTDFNVCASTISHIARGHTWKHILRESQPDRRNSYTGNLDGLKKACEAIKQKSLRRSSRPIPT